MAYIPGNNSTNSNSLDLISSEGITPFGSTSINSVCDSYPRVFDLKSPYFTLNGIAYDYNGDRRSVYMMEALRDDLMQIGIELNYRILDWFDYVNELISTRDFDICNVGLSGSAKLPDYRGIYDEDGSLNIFGYDTSMDWSDALGTGINQWYMEQFMRILPPDSQERIDLFKDWQQHLMDNILPAIPTFTPYIYSTTWSNLAGFDYEEGIIKSWGKMHWTDYHYGQAYLNNFNISENQWSNLNPLFQDYSDEFVTDAIMDNLIEYDQDGSFWPHILENYYLLSDTCLRLEVRQGIQWQRDPDGLFLNEYVDAEDIYFSLYSWKELSDDYRFYEWIKDIQIVDQYTVDIIIDADPGTPEEDVYAGYLENLVAEVLPEHYLNQTQLADGVTPDITHVSWNVFATNPFGTSIFELSSFTPDVETILTINDDCWYFNPTVDKTNMDFVNRFGNYWTLDNLVIRHDIDVADEIYQFEMGNLDYENLAKDHGIENLDYYEENSQFKIYSKLSTSFRFFGLNMREIRGTPMQSRDPCQSDPTITQGLAIRKAMAYATNKEAMKEQVYETEQLILDCPIYPLEKWVNNDIIKYDFDLTKAREAMALAGFDMSIDTDGDGISDFEELNIYSTDPYDSNSVPTPHPKPFFEVTMLCPDTNPARIEMAYTYAAELAKIGICVKEIVVTGWDFIASRTWGYEGSYPIPGYDEGGYDMLFVGYNFKDFTPRGLYDSYSMPPSGSNFYQYNNPLIDSLIDDYYEAFDYSNRISIAHDILGILHDDLPSIPIINGLDIFGVNEDLQNNDMTQWTLHYDGMENWMIPFESDLHYAHPYDYNSFQIIQSATSKNMMWLGQIYDGLFYREPETRLWKPKLIESYSTIDGLTYQFTLKSNVVWADGMPLTTEDIVFTYELYELYDSYLIPTIDSITPINAYEFEVTLTETNYQIEIYFSYGILPKHIWESVLPEDIFWQANEWAVFDPSKIIGTGPYKLDNYIEGSTIKLTENPYYSDWNVDPYFTNIYFDYYADIEGALTDLKYGFIDVIDEGYGLTPDDLLYPGITYAEGKGTILQELALNQLNPYYGTGELCPIIGAQSANYIRQAMCHMFDREYISEEIFNGTVEPASQHYNYITALSDSSLEPCDYDIDEAIYYMALAGFDMITDTDGDGLLDYMETGVYNTDPNNPDTDSDGIDDYEEVFEGTDGYVTDPLTSDTDNDGIEDLEEITIGVDGYITDPTVDDTDGDGLLDGDEINTFGTDPTTDDSDNDGLGDWDEIYDYETDPTDDDSDSDGLADGEEVYEHFTDPKDSDTDNDGFSDGVEVANGWDPLDPESPDILNDMDQDGLTNEHEELLGTDPTVADTDADGLLDGEEVFVYHTNPKIADSDSDGLIDGMEIKVHNTDPLLYDTDGDILNDYDELYLYQTDPLDEDTDDDQLLDGYEINFHFTIPYLYDSDFDGLSDGEEILVYNTDPLIDDMDGDGLTDGEEILLYNSNHLVVDTDNDLLTDYEETKIYFTNPIDVDTDDDGLTDYEEIDTYGTDPIVFDSDSDGASDKWEIDNGFDPLDPNDANVDLDGDGLTNAEEYIHGTDPNDYDTDNDLLPDGEEINIHGTNPLIADSDGDRLSDWHEVLIFGTNPFLVDTDGDYLYDGNEIGNNTNPLLPDTDADGLIDSVELLYYLTDPTNPDTDADGYTDGEEVAAGTDPLDDKDYPGASADKLRDDVSLTDNRTRIIVLSTTIPLLTVALIAAFFGYRYKKKIRNA